MSYNVKINLIFFFFIVLTSFVYAGDYGYEKLDNGKVLHLWNPALSYYFNASSGLQFTNHYEEYWSKNIFCVGWYSGGWNDKCNDGAALTSFKWTITTDNTTFVSAEGKKNITFAGEKVEARLNYTLNENQDDLIIRPSLENVDTSDITEDIRFGWKVMDINVGNSQYDNIVNVGINNDFVNLSNTSNKKYTSLSAKQYLITMEDDWMRYKWDYNNYTLYIRNEAGQFNALLSLVLWNRGLDVGQKKATNLFWIDATCILALTDETPDSYDTFWDGNITHDFSGCVQPDTSCPIDEACDNLIEIHSRAEGQTWTKRTEDFAENRECPNNLTYPINLQMEHDNKTDWRLVYRAFGLGEVACEEIYVPRPPQPYRKTIRLDYWWNANSPIVENVSVNVTGDNLTCMYHFFDGDGDAENTSGGSGTPAPYVDWFLAGEKVDSLEDIISFVGTNNENYACCVRATDSVFETRNETSSCSSHDALPQFQFIIFFVIFLLFIFWRKTDEWIYAFLCGVMLMGLGISFAFLDFPDVSFFVRNVALIVFIGMGAYILIHSSLKEVNK